LKKYTRLEKRKLDIAVISDVHLGTYGCRATELGRYLSTIDPGLLVLNGDIVDTWQFGKKYWPQSHMQVIKQITSMLSRGVKVYYITGNHDERMRRFAHFSLGDFHVVNKLVVQHESGRKSWIFHGDVFDATIQYSKWLAKMGTVGYNLLIRINSFTNYIHGKLGKSKTSLSNKIKHSVRSAVTFIRNFEDTAAGIAIQKQYDFVVCGHIHQPCKKQVQTQKGAVTYLNSGDWVENLTALECTNDDWQLYYYNADKLVKELDNSFYMDEAAYLQTAELFKMMMKDVEKAS
jgi:UDP-2,3-diacylglucosamine pyrophosphatase LpxH